MTATIDAIFIASAKAGPVTAVPSAVAVVDRGLQGDRYAANVGTFSKPREELDSGRNVTLIEAEAIEGVLAEHGLTLSNGLQRRNLVTRGLAMKDLPTNAHLTIGDEVILRVDRTCPPCGHLERLVPGTMNALKGRGGLRTTVIRGGTLNVGDAIVVRSRREVADLMGETSHV